MALKPITKRVLLVDDKKDLLEVYEGIFSQMEGYSYHSCNDGLVAYRLARNQKFDLILTDYVMPRLNGVQLIKAIRENFINANTPIVVISAFPDRAMNELKSERLSHNINIMSKPFELAAIESLAETLTSKTGGGNQFKIDVEFINPFLSSTVTVLKQMGNLKDIKISKPELKNSGHTFNSDISSLLSVVSPMFNGAMVLSFPKETFLKISNSALGETQTEITDSNKDFAGELSNIIFGKVKTDWNEKGFAVEKAIPLVFVHPQYSLSAGINIINLIVEFNSEVGHFYGAISVLAV